MVQGQKSALEKLKTGIYLAVAEVQREVRQRKGLIGETVGKLEEVWDSFPTKEELDTRYKGIGAKHRQPLLIVDYENCLRFLETARELIPGSEGLREQIFKDIQDSASGNRKDLTHYYQTQYDPYRFFAAEVVDCKMDVVDKYLKKSS